MQKELHVVLGGSGAIGGAVIKALKEKNMNIRAVERSKEVLGVQTVIADLLDKNQCSEAIKGATHVYLCVGLPYRIDVWQRDWPKLMESVIEACEVHNAKMIFFDNAYMYGPSPLDIPFDENHTQEPATKKGRARKQASDLLLHAHRSGKIQAVIGRSADFYGPGAVNSPFYIKFLENMLQNKNPQILGRAGVEHTYAYTLDNGRALVTLAIDDSSYGKVWHLPVGKPVTIEEVLGIFNKHLRTNFKVSYLPRPMLGLISLFVPGVKEAEEMLYQFDNPYIMSDQKFSNKYPTFKATYYEDGIVEMINSFKNINVAKNSL